MYFKIDIKYFFILIIINLVIDNSLPIDLYKIF